MRHAEQAVQGGAQFVADGGDEAALGGKGMLGRVAGLGEPMFAPEPVAIGAGAGMRDRQDNCRKRQL